MASVFVSTTNEDHDQPALSGQSDYDPMVDERYFLDEKMDKSITEIQQANRLMHDHWQNDGSALQLFGGC